MIELLIIIFIVGGVLGLMALPSGGTILTYLGMISFTIGFLMIILSGYVLAEIPYDNGYADYMNNEEYSPPVITIFNEVFSYENNAIIINYEAGWDQAIQDDLQNQGYEKGYHDFTHNFIFNDNITESSYSNYYKYGYKLGWVAGDNEVLEVILHDELVTNRSTRNELLATG